MTVGENYKIDLITTPYVKIDGVVINTLYEAFIWLREAWKYEPYNISYEKHSETMEVINIESTKEFDGCDFYLFNLKEFKNFIGV